MTIPSFYDPERVGQLYMPDVAGAVAAGQSAGANPSTGDRARVLLVLVDTQVDFVHEDGALSVPGAVADTRRTIEWLFRNLGKVTDIVASLDSHIPFQIFYPGWWVNADGEHPGPYTLISAEDVAQRTWMPTVEEEWSASYVAELEEQAKKVLTIWPYHTMIGTPGHAITPALYEAITYHTSARSVEPDFYIKGSIPKTEHYSILEPEVKVEDEPLGVLNTDLLKRFATYDRIYIAGQAKSHCVLETVTSIVRYFEETREDLIGKLRLLGDCTSSVAHPEIDFEALASAELANFQQQGLQIVESTDPVDL
jgi:nicotinamidase/pyrazinamidase